MDSNSNGSSRRQFIKAAGRRAMYMAPAVMVLAASEANASHSPAHPCYPLYSTCTADADCCAGLLCQGDMTLECCKQAGQPCGTGMECCNMCMNGTCT